jgi:sirohydrochlorin ferrochelatase
VLVPFFVSDGLHVAEDIPVLLGEAPDRVRERLAAGLPACELPLHAAPSGCGTRLRLAPNRGWSR